MNETTHPPADGSASRRGDEALRRSEERYRALVEATSQAVWCWSPGGGGGDFAQTRQWWEDVTGQSADEQGRSHSAWLDVVHPDDREAARSAWSTALASGVKYDIEYRVRDRGGGWRHIHACGVPIRRADGSIREWVGTLDDITDRRRAEADSRRTESRFRRLASASIIGIIHWDLDRGLILDANDEFLRMTGYDRADLAAGRLDFRAMTPPEWTARNEAGIRDLRATGVGGAYEKEYFRKDGSRVPIIIVGVRFEDAPAEGMSFILDITARKRAEAELAEREELLRLATQAAELGIWVWDPVTDHVVWENSRPYEIFGLAPSSGPVNASRFLADFVHPDDAAAFREAMSASIRHGIRFYFLGRLRRPDGEIRWVEFAGLPVRGGDGTPLRMHGTAADVTAIKQAEAENRRLLREVEAERKRLADVFQHAPSFMGVLRGPDHVFERANDRYLELVGRRDLLGRPLREAVPDAGGQGFFEILDRVYRTGEPYVGTAARIALVRGGVPEERFLDFVYQPLRDPDGAVSGVLFQGVDLTDRVRAEAGQARLAESLALALEAVELGTWEWDPTTDQITLSARAAEIYAVAPGRTYSREWMRGLIRADHRDRTREASARAVRERSEYDMEYPLERGGWVSARGRGVYGADGTLTRMLGVVQDVTAYKRAQEEVVRVTAESERRKRLFETALSNTADFVYLFDLDGRFTYVNKALLDLWGKDFAEAAGKNFFELGYPPELAARLQWQIQEVITSRQPLRDETPYTSAFGTRAYEYILVPVFAADGAVEAVAGSTRDITERKDSERALHESDRKKDEFIALLAHELRNPLAPIRTGVQILRLSGGDDRALGMMERQLTHMVRLIDDLLDVSRIGRSKMELRRARVPLADVVTSAVETARPLIDEAGHELRVSLPPGPVHLDADLTRLSQVFSNLLTNSAKYTGRGGTIWLSAAARDGTVTVTVRDTGIGIPADALPTIFDMFSQVDRSVERSTGGLGIGLALVKGLVEMHGGTVTARSGGQGQGSEFTVTLPAVAEQREPAERAPDAAPITSGKRRVLVVDDSRDGADSLAMMLRLLGNDVATAHDGLEAVERAESFRPEVILMDIGLPRLNGLDATRRIRERPWGQAAAIIALTGWGQESDRERSRAAGCDGHLVKPVAPADLEGLLSKLMAVRRA